MACIYGWFATISAIIVGLQILRRVLPWIYENFVGPAIVGASLNLRKYGEWAVVTGATDGIGKEYAKTLAQQGLNVVLISRTLSKLQDVAKEIESEFKVETRVIDADFRSAAAIYDKIGRGLDGLQVGVLVNNVGMSYASPEYFLSVPNRDELFADLVRCNVDSVLAMTKLALPQMVERRRGVVINVSSLSAVIPAPLISVYAATKAFVDKLADDLATEYAAQGIVVQSVLPGPVATNMSKIKKATWMAPTAKRFVASAIRTVGIARHTTGYYPHALLQAAINLIRFASESLSQRITMSTMVNIRSRALRKMQQEAAKAN